MVVPSTVTDPPQPITTKGSSSSTTTSHDTITDKSINQINNQPTNGTDNGTATIPRIRQHVMISYAWGAKKELVVGMAVALRSLGYDVWRDEEGSEIVPSMSGDTDERMAQAIESSHTVIVCVSPQYKVPQTQPLA